MRTKNKIINDIIGLLTNINFQKIKGIKDKSDKDALLKYINEEFLDLNEYKALISEIKLNKQDILEIIYQMLNILINNKQKSQNNSTVTETLIKKANNYGFKWSSSDSCFNKVEEELIELKNAIKKNDTKNIQEEIGDLIFTLHCYANMKNYNIEQILNNANSKFKKRFDKLLNIAKEKKVDIEKSSPEIKEKLWKIAKNS